MINYHHIGGRNGTYPLPLKQGLLLNDFHLVLYDADENCLEQMGKANHDQWGQVSVYPYCIGGKNEKRSFCLNFHPTTNSLYPFNERFSEYGFVDNPMYGEYRLGDACGNLQSVELDLYTLDNALRNAEVKTVDFLSLDVQGAEYDILFGAKDRLQSECVGIELEAEFVELYRGQKRFFEINALLESIGFELIEIERFGRCAPITLPIGYRGLEQPLSAEAIYVKKLDNLLQVKDPELIYKAAFFNLLYKKVGLCIKYLERAVALDEKTNKESSMPAYKMLLLKIWQLYQNDSEFTFPTISQLCSHQEFQAYYGQGKNTHKLFEGESEVKIKQLHEYISKLSGLESSPLETLLNQYTLYEIAEEIKKRRLYEMKCVEELERKRLRNVV